VDPVPDPLLLRKSGSAWNRTRDLWICSQELWPLDHRGGLNWTLQLMIAPVTCFNYTVYRSISLELWLKFLLNFPSPPPRQKHSRAWQCRRWSESLLLDPPIRRAHSTSGKRRRYPFFDKTNEFSGQEYHLRSYIVAQLVKKFPHLKETEKARSNWSLFWA
jgi:hypothetical protein